MIFLILIVLVILVAIGLRKTPLTIKSHWQHFYDGCQISTTDFYQQVKAGLKERKIEVGIREEKFLESHILSAKRVYLKITENEFVFYVCAAPFGTGTFISWWLCVKDEKVINKIPVLSKLAGKDRGNKTFYQMDTEAMYQSAIHSTVLAVADNITAGKGLRELSDLERMFKESSK